MLYFSPRSEGVRRSSSVTSNERKGRELRVPSSPPPPKSPQLPLIPPFYFPCGVPADSPKEVLETQLAALKRLFPPTGGDLSTCAKFCKHGMVINYDAILTSLSGWRVVTAVTIFFHHLFSSSQTIIDIPHITSTP